LNWTKKKGPISGAKSKEADGRKSGKVFEDAASAEKAARADGSRTIKEEDRAHCYVRPLFLLLRNCTCQAKPYPPNRRFRTERKLLLHNELSEGFENPPWTDKFCHGAEFCTQAANRRALAELAF
jgi:hypothetical protein